MTAANPSTFLTRRRWARAGKTRGLTLVEVMMSVTLLTLFTVTLMAAMVEAYRLAAAVRLRDQARFVLSSASDQFLQGSYYLGDGSTVQPFFTPVATPTGVGMAWQKNLQVFAFPPTVSDPDYVIGLSTGLAIVVGQGSGSPITANLTRQVSTVDPATGNPAAVAPTAAGLLLRGVFSATYTYQGKVYTYTNTVLRSAP